MSKERLSVAQRRAKRRKAQGKATGEFDFNFSIDAPSLTEYYRLTLSDREVKKLANEYGALNLRVEQEFLQKTKLDKIDLPFLFLAVALQCARQYFLTSFAERVGHTYTKKADKLKANKIHTRLKDHENFIGQQGGYYYRNLDKIILDGVPYDAMGLDTGLSGNNHRYRTLGHDPVLGWVFGPMNIMTSTLTTYTMASYHVRKKARVDGVMTPVIYSRAKNDKIFDACIQRLKHDPAAFAASIAKQAIHYNSDVNTKRSLPVPFVQTISPEYANKLADYGIDMANLVNIGKQATYAMLINTIIATIHRLFYDPSRGISEELYSLKTRKILTYSNIIASVSNVIYVAFTKDIKKLDIGGVLITLFRIVTDDRFIRQVMHEFVDSEVSRLYEEQLSKADAEFEELAAKFGY